jgi:hypothetical protein
MKKLLAISLLFSVPALAVSPVLIPTMYNGPGAFGTHWATAVMVNNYASAPFSSPGVLFTVLCTIPEGCLSDTLLPGGVGGIGGPYPPPANGLLLYLPDPETDTAFMARIAASPRSPLYGGTELPIVREREFVRRTIHFPDVPIIPFDTTVRTTLRIYGVDAEPGTTVRVQLVPWSTAGGFVQASRDVVLTVPAQPAAGKIFPAFAQVNLQDVFRSGSVHLEDSHNIEVVPLPLPSGQIPRIWAFITITDNISQEVTLQGPQ